MGGEYDVIRGIYDVTNSVHDVIIEKKSQCDYLFVRVHSSKIAKVKRSFENFWMRASIYMA